MTGNYILRFDEKREKAIALYLELWYDYGHKGGVNMPQIIPIKELKNTSEISELCHKAEGPIFITKNGYGDMAIMSMEIYESMAKQLAMYQDLELSGKQAEEGQVKDARKSLAEMRAKYGI